MGIGPTLPPSCPPQWTDRPEWHRIHDCSAQRPPGGRHQRRPPASGVSDVQPDSQLSPSCRRALKGVSAGLGQPEPFDAGKSHITLYSPAAPLRQAPYSPAVPSQALWQAPDPPGCFDVILSSGLLEACVGTEEDSASGSISSPEGTRTPAGGLRDALTTARCLVEMNRNGRSLTSVSATGAASAARSDNARPCPAPNAFAVMLERRGLLDHARRFHGLEQVLAGTGWALVHEALPDELAVWLAGPSPSEGAWKGPVAEHLDLILLCPLDS